jgi:glycosyltransferase involved in cell wall biosynthesis
MSDPVFTVLHVAQPTTDGVGRYVSALVRDQAARGWEVSLATPPDSDLEAHCMTAGVRWLRWNARREPGPSVAFEARALRRIVDDVRPDVVHLHSSKAGLVGRLVLRGGKPTILTPHAWSFLSGGRMLRWAALIWERRAARWTSVCLCVSGAERIRGERARIGGRFEVVPNGVNLEHFHPVGDAERASDRAGLGLTGEPVVVCVGRLAAQKGQDVLLRAWEIVEREINDARLVFGGDGPRRDDLRDRSGPHVMFAGRVNDVRPFYAIADVVALPSRWEGLSFVVLEALASGCSVVASDVDGMNDVLGGPSGSCGAVVPTEDVGALAGALVERLGDPNRVARERVAARGRAEHFGIDQWAAGIARITGEVARGANS